MYRVSSTIVLAAARARCTTVGKSYVALPSARRRATPRGPLQRGKQLTGRYRSYTHATELAEERFAAGDTTLLTVLTAQRSLYSARDALAQSSADVALEYISLSLALGGGWNPNPPN